MHVNSATGPGRDHFRTLVGLDESRTVAASTPLPAALIMSQKLAVSVEDAEGMAKVKLKFEILAIGIERDRSRLLCQARHLQETLTALSVVTDH